jgi:hypothetical protein
MRYVAGYAAYAIGITSLLLYMVQPRPALDQAPRPYVGGGNVPVTLVVIDTDDYLSQRCLVKVAALATDTVLFNNRDEFDRAREALGC